ncbi:LLM class flavin-dependent oxidoreductase [Paractinoplanes atraurantiacus]|uniref:Flavin-dependent oxidoreductase, luciferase family (Includes alkanesulfonate monooxygenase SsuD and methylene tetrahydromethanopterin reductase) n=1 Tax=Paractinoplanes atraurantiacus TaxID=1036182 RepID=A0A285K7J1_9ACTN|nr:LLM class flavin-dependent oxidoreductase [Actinoplanes atraurantiacus]SNY68572.1 Flavin-dependent oxidoreductase, luciferase family (includes alkanesulfonate monooxygenase SsuD and methylene tetrahydromethanopterin reductase) [Actinoplanes atraurantiacus]
MAQPLHLAVALDGAGWHPAAWRTAEARPAELFTAGYWADLVREAESGTLDFVTIEDSFGREARLDAVLIAARVAPLTSRIGLVPTATVTHTEPFHISKALATLDYVSTGRAGWRVQLSARPEEAAHFGRRAVPGIQEHFDEAADFVEVVRRLWDSWEDDAEIRDAATGRFIDREKLHYIDFDGKYFSVKGPSITPRPPQGQPPVTALAHADIPYAFATGSADLVYVTPAGVDDARQIVAKVSSLPHVFADLVVFLEDSEQAARDAKARLDELAGSPYTSDASIFTGTPSQLADLLLTWQEAGLTGFRLRPGRLPADLEAITRGLVPELRQRGAFRKEYEASTLRGLLGLTRPANRYRQEAPVA